MAAKETKPAKAKYRHIFSINCVVSVSDRQRKASTISKKAAKWRHGAKRAMALKSLSENGGGGGSVSAIA
jgi:hypothetical protein